jgi:CHAT domain-containing protein
LFLWPAFFLLLILAIQFQTSAESRDDSVSVGTVLLQRGLELLTRESYDSAYSFCDQAARLLKGRDWESYLKCANYKSRSLIVKGNVDSAEIVIRAAIDVAAPHVPETSLAIAETHTYLSYFYSYHDRPDSGICHDRWSLNIRRSILGPNHPVLAGNYYSLALAFRKKGFYGEAEQNLRECLRLYSTNLVQSASTANILMLLGNVLRERAEYVQATRCLDSSLAILRTLGLERSHSMITGMIYLAACHAEAGQFTLAVSLYDSAAALAKVVDPNNQTLLVSIRTSVGNVYAQMGDYDRALDAFNDGLFRTRQYNFGTPAGIGEIHQYSASACVEKGDFAAARTHAMAALRLKSTALGKDHPDLAAAREVLAEVEEGTGHYAGALAHLREALRIRLLVPGGASRPDLANLLIKIAGAHLRMHRLDSAAVTVERASIFLRRSPQSNPLLSARMQEVKADIHHERNMPAAAVAAYDAAMASLCQEDSAKSVVNDAPSDLARGVHLLRVLRKKGICLAECSHDPASAIERLSSALHAYEQASQTLLKLRSSYESEGSKFRLLEEFSDIFERGIGVALRLRELTRREDYLESAFCFAELNKAGILLEGIRNARVREFAGVPSNLLLNVRSLKTRLTASELQLSKALDLPAGDSARVQTLQWNALSLREELRLATEQLRRASPSYAHLFAGDDFALMKKVQQTLDDSTLLVEYFLGDKAAYAFVIGKQKSDVHILRSPTGIISAAGTLMRSIRTVDRDGFTEAARRLYAQVISPFAHTLASYSRMIVVPDKDLSSVPFEVLLPPGSSRTGSLWDFPALPFLIRSHEIAMSPSARLFCESGSPQTNEPVEALNFAGFAPVFCESTATGLILASNRFANGLDTTQLRSISVNGRRFRELSFSDAEVTGIADEFTKRALQARAFLNDMATEENFKRNAPLFTYLHVATHGLVNGRDPSRSALVFAQAGDTVNGEDGVLYAAEAYNLDLRAELVVLSSCESGIGRYVTGEGVYALMRGFLHSGARNIVYSLWQVMDHQTSELMQHFYDGVLKGWRFGKALQMAKLQMLSHERTAFPFSWAGFVLIGNSPPGLTAPQISPREARSLPPPVSSSKDPPAANL